MKQYTLDDIRRAADARYGSTEIETSQGTVELVNVMRMDKERRKKLVTLQEKLGDEKVDADEQEEILMESLRLVCKTEKQADILTKELGGDLALIASTFEFYSGDTQTGEASGSQS